LIGHRLPFFAPATSSHEAPAADILPGFSFLVFFLLLIMEYCPRIPDYSGF